jgi:hypothetical protein
MIFENEVGQDKAKTLANVGKSLIIINERLIFTPL